MEIPILSRQAATTPTSGNGFLFFDSGNANALTVKFIDCSFKVLSAEPYQLNESQSLIDAQNDFLDVLKCGVKQGTVTMAELQTLLESFQLYYSSTIDSNGNLNQSISYTAPTVSSGDFSISEIGANSNVITTAYTSGASANQDVYFEIDREGTIGDVAVSFSSPFPSITLAGGSSVSNSLGTLVNSVDLIADGTSAYIGELIYDGTAIAVGVYTGVITVSNGSVNKFISVEITIS